jgi:hypothetical protein
LPGGAGLAAADRIGGIDALVGNRWSPNRASPRPRYMWLPDGPPNLSQLGFHLMHIQLHYQ